MHSSTTTHLEMKYPREVHSSFSISVLKVLNVAAFVTLLVVSILAGKHYFGHATPKHIYLKHAVSLTPASYAFIIEMVLLVLQGIFVVYQALPLHNFHVDLYLHKLSIFLPLTWLMQAGAVIAWIYEVFWLSGLFLLAGVLTAFVAYFRLQTVPLRLMPLLFNNRFYWTHRYHITHRYGGVARRDVVVEENEDVDTLGDKLRAILHYFVVLVPVSVNLAWLVFGLVAIIPVVFRGANTIGWGVALCILLGALAVVHNYWQQDIWYPFAIVWSLIAVAIARHHTVTHIGTAAWVVVACILTFWLIHLFILQPYWTFKTDRRDVARRERDPLVSP